MADRQSTQVDPELEIQRLFQGYTNSGRGQGPVGRLWVFLVSNRPWIGSERGIFSLDQMWTRIIVRNGLVNRTLDLDWVER